MRDDARYFGGKEAMNPAVPGVECLGGFSDGSLLDAVAVALYDAEPYLTEQLGDSMRPAFLHARQVMARVRVKGQRSQHNTEAHVWRLAIPGLLGVAELPDAQLLTEITVPLYNARREIVLALPEMPIDRALPLAEALVIAETQKAREGSRIDEAGPEGLTYVQAAAADARDMWELLQRDGLAVELSPCVREWARKEAA